MSRYDKLILSPHVDDEVLGCGGMLDKNTFVIYCGLDESHIKEDWVRSRPKREERMLELDMIVNITNHNYEILDNKVNHYTLQNLINSFEKNINDIKPSEVYIPHPSYNQDHRTVYEAALTALRPHDINHFVKKVFIYEQPHMLFWDDKDFKPNYFIPIDIERKIKLYELMETQVRNFRSIEHLRAIAKLRGGQSNYEYAEAFKILRWVD
tara:strand:+ start:8343 stop:8972 length:630 start_codon:yes stop_codon:yes gene_type:complete